MTSEIKAVAAIPIEVVHIATPCIWKLKKCSRRWKQKAADGPLCFVAHDLPWFTVKRGVRLQRDYGYQNSVSDGWMVRDRFMGLRGEQDVMTFLRKFGTMTPLSESESASGWQLTEILALQRLFGELARRSPETWSGIELPPNSPPSWSRISEGALNSLLRSARPTITFEWTGGVLTRQLYGAKHLAVVWAHDIVSAIIATIEIDHLRGAKFGLCARPDCPRFFEKVSNHNKIYCTQKCGHLVSVRNTRERQRSARAKASLKKASKKAGTKKPPLKIAPKQP
jgi:hypothetical protein